MINKKIFIIICLVIIIVHLMFNNKIIEGLEITSEKYKLATCEKKCNNYEILSVGFFFIKQNFRRVYTSSTQIDSKVITNILNSNGGFNFDKNNNNTLYFIKDNTPYIFMIDNNKISLQIIRKNVNFKDALIELIKLNNYIKFDTTKYDNQVLNLDIGNELYNIYFSKKIDLNINIDNINDYNITSIKQTIDSTIELYNNNFNNLNDHFIGKLSYGNVIIYCICKSA